MSDTAQGAEPQPNTANPQGGNAPQTVNVQAAPQSAQQEDVSRRIEQSLERLFTRYGSPEAASSKLLEENYGYREKNRGLESQVNDLTAQVEALSAYKALGDDPKAIAELLDKGRAAIEREHARELADVSGANARVLADRLKLDGLTAEVKTVKVDGQDVKQVHIVKDGEDLGELKAYAEANWQDYTAALFPATQQRQGVPVIPQAGATASAPENPVAAALKRNGSQGDKPVVSAFDFSGGSK